jgi:hypothetical protein
MREASVAFLTIGSLASCGGLLCPTVDDGGLVDDRGNACTISFWEVSGTNVVSLPDFKYLTWSCGPDEYVAECDCTYYLLADAGNTTFQPQILTCSANGVAQRRVGSSMCCVEADHASPSLPVSAWATLCGFP